MCDREQQQLEHMQLFVVLGPIAAHSSIASSMGIHYWHINFQFKCIVDYWLGCWVGGPHTNM